MKPNSTSFTLNSFTSDFKYFLEKHGNNTNNSVPAIKPIYSKLTSKLKFTTVNSSLPYKLEYYKELSITKSVCPKSIVRLGKSEHIKITANDSRPMQLIGKDVLLPITCNTKSLEQLNRKVLNQIDLVDIAIKSKTGAINEDTGEIVQMIPTSNGFKVKYIR